MFEVRIDTDLAQEPVTLAEVRDYLRITTTSEDTLLAELITSARERLEKHTGLSFGVKTLVTRWDALNSLAYGQELPYQPNADVDSVLDDDGNTITYEIKGLEYKKIYCVGNQGVNITYDAGFETLPKALKNALLKEVSTEYENRENFYLKGTYELSDSAKNMVQTYKRNLWFGI